MTTHRDVLTVPAAPNGVVDTRPALRGAIDTVTTVAAAVRAEDLVAPTPCDEMNVRALLAHLVGVLDRIAALGGGDDPLAVVEAPAPADEWVAAIAAAGGRALESWRDDAVLARPMTLPWISDIGANVLATYVAELTVHTWDLAVATGQPPTWDDAVLATASSAPPILPEENRLALFEQISADMGLDQVAAPFAEAVPVGDDAPAIDRLVAWYGRDPR